MGASGLSRRAFLGAVPAVAGAVALRTPKATDIRIDDVRHRFEDFRYRTPMKFGGREVDRVTMLHVEVAVRTRNGRRATGAASMPLGNVWAYPSRQLPFERTLGAMRALADRLAPLLRSCSEYGHPIDLGVQFRASPASRPTPGSTCRRQASTGPGGSPPCSPCATAG